MRPTNGQVGSAGFARRDGLPTEVEVLRLEERLGPPHDDRLTIPTRAAFHSVLLIDDGVSAHHVDFEPWAIGPRHLLVIPDGHVQWFDPARVISGSLVLFTSAFLERCHVGMRGLIEATRAPFRRGANVRLSERSASVVREGVAVVASHASFEPSDPYAQEIAASTLSLLLFKIASLTEMRDLFSGQREDELVTRFLELLDDQFRSNRTASTYARALGVAPRTLDRHLVASCGQTTRQAISARVVLEARRLLTDPNEQIQTVAYRLGFSEPQNFTRFIRTQTGRSPQGLRASTTGQLR